MIHPIGTTPDGIEVYIDLVNSDASESIARQPQLIRLAKEALTGRKLTGPNVQIEHNMGRVVGYDCIIEATEDDNVFYAQMLRDKLYTRFIKGGKPLATNYVAIVLKRDADGKAYALQDVRIGRLAPPRPGMPNETTKSRDFWSAHAYVQEGQLLQLRTVTKQRPY